MSPEYFGVDDLYFSLRVIRIGGAGSMHEEDEKWVQSVGGKSVTERDHLVIVDVTFRCILKKADDGTEFLWHGTRR
jgi:hypothetical protein